MRATNPFDDDAQAKPSSLLTYSASRVLVGPCPACHTPLVVFNDGESWPLVGCPCGWRGGTTDLTTVRFDRHEGVRRGDGVFPPSMHLRVPGADHLVMNTRTPQGNVSRNADVRAMALFHPDSLETSDNPAVLIMECEPAPSQSGSTQP